ncbi:HNH endonuclease [Priestia megaterium]|uniref:HNH endonuclease n=1 Tax=Priestia megaterium TaxID=1404 RepID=UPI00159BF4F4|nr:HNH endonuclease [Priestia megaterium]
MSKSNEMIKIAARKGYTISKSGEIINPKGRVVKGTIIKVKNSTYKTFAINDKGMSRPVLVHRFVAYRKFGEMALEAEYIKHLNGNSLDNRPNNIEVGTYKDVYKMPESNK